MVLAKTSAAVTRNLIREQKVIQTLNSAVCPTLELLVEHIQKAEKVLPLVLEMQTQTQ